MLTCVDDADDDDDDDDHHHNHHRRHRHQKSINTMLHRNFLQDFLLDLHPVLLCTMPWLTVWDVSSRSYVRVWSGANENDGMQFF
eukprot:10490289-Karenia_brevis.AAC.1